MSPLEQPCLTARSPVSIDEEPDGTSRIVFMHCHNELLQKMVVNHITNRRPHVCRILRLHAGDQIRGFTITRVGLLATFICS